MNIENFLKNIKPNELISIVGKVGVLMGGDS